MNNLRKAKVLLKAALTLLNQKENLIAGSDDFSDLSIEDLANKLHKLYAASDPLNHFPEGTHYIDHRGIHNIILGVTIDDSLNMCKNHNIKVRTKKKSPVGNYKFNFIIAHTNSCELQIHAGAVRKRVGVADNVVTISFIPFEYAMVPQIKK